MGAAAAVAGITAGAGLIGGALQSRSVSGANNQAQQTLAQQRGDLAPWRGTGGLANTASADLLGLNGPDAATAAMGRFQTSPGYQFSLEQGLRGVDAGAAAKGMLRSGATLKAEQAYGSGLADQEFSNYYNRLFDMSKVGESAAAGGAYTAAAGANAAQNAGQQQASIYGNTVAGLSSTVNSLANNPNFIDRTNALFSQPTNVGYPSSPSVYGVVAPGYG